jgi:hypothetical protein
MAAKLTGTISKGQGDAHINYKVLIPQVALHCPDIAKCDQFGTINIKLDHPIDKNHADCWSPQISWKPVTTLGNERLEAFGLIRIALQFPIDGQTYTAWIIISEGHPNSYHGDDIEVICEVHIPGVDPGKTCAIYIDHTPLIPRPDWFGRHYEKHINAMGIFKDTKGLFLHPFKP